MSEFVFFKGRALGVLLEGFKIKIRCSIIESFSSSGTATTMGLGRHRKGKGKGKGKGKKSRRKREEYEENDTTLPKTRRRISFDIDGEHLNSVVRDVRKYVPPDCWVSSNAFAREVRIEQKGKTDMNLRDVRIIFEGGVFKVAAFILKTPTVLSGGARVKERICQPVRVGTSLGVRLTRRDSVRTNPDDLYYTYDSEKGRDDIKSLGTTPLRLVRPPLQFSITRNPQDFDYFVDLASLFDAIKAFFASRICDGIDYDGSSIQGFTNNQIVRELSKGEFSGRRQLTRYTRSGETVLYRQYSNHPDSPTRFPFMISSGQCNLLIKSSPEHNVPLSIFSTCKPCAQLARSLFRFEDIKVTPPYERFRLAKDSALRLARNSKRCSSARITRLEKRLKECLRDFDALLQAPHHEQSDSVFDDDDNPAPVLTACETAASAIGALLHNEYIINDNAVIATALLEHQTNVIKRAMEGGKKSGIRYSLDVWAFAVRILRASPLCYDILRSVMCLPHARNIEKGSFLPTAEEGVTAGSLQLLAERLSKIPAAERGTVFGMDAVALSLDACSLKQGVYFDRNTKRIYGFTSPKAPSLKKAMEGFNASFLTHQELAGHCSLLMVSTVHDSKLVFPLACWMTASLQADQVTRMLNDAIRGLFLIRVVAVSIALDGASENRKCVKKLATRSVADLKNLFPDFDPILSPLFDLSLKVAFAHPYVENLYIFFTNDYPHLLKKLRNALWHSGVAASTCRPTSQAAAPAAARAPRGKPPKGKRWVGGCWVDDTVELNLLHLVDEVVKVCEKRPKGKAPAGKMWSREHGCYVAKKKKGKNRYTRLLMRGAATATWEQVVQAWRADDAIQDPFKSHRVRKDDILLNSFSLMRVAPAVRITSPEFRNIIMRYIPDSGFLCNLLKNMNVMFSVLNDDGVNEDGLRELAAATAFFIKWKNECKCLGTGYGVRSSRRMVPEFIPATSYFDMMTTVAALPCVYDMYFKKAPLIKPRRFSQDCVERAFADLRRSNPNFRALDARSAQQRISQLQTQEAVGSKKGNSKRVIKIAPVMKRRGKKKQLQYL